MFLIFWYTKDKLMDCLMSTNSKLLMSHFFFLHQKELPITPHNFKKLYEKLLERVYPIKMEFKYSINLNQIPFDKFLISKHPTSEIDYLAWCQKYNYPSITANYIDIINIKNCYKINPRLMLSFFKFSFKNTLKKHTFVQ